jgi:hypothetical protein
VKRGEEEIDKREEKRQKQRWKKAATQRCANKIHKRNRKDRHENEDRRDSIKQNKSKNVFHVRCHTQQTLSS